MKSLKNLTSVIFGGELVAGALSGLGMLSISSKILVTFWSDIWIESKGNCPDSLNLFFKESMSKVPQLINLIIISIKLHITFVLKNMKVFCIQKSFI